MYKTYTILPPLFSQVDGSAGARRRFEAGHQRTEAPAAVWRHPTSHPAQTPGGVRPAHPQEVTVSPAKTRLSSTVVHLVCITHCVCLRNGNNLQRGCNYNIMSLRACQDFSLFSYWSHSSCPSVKFTCLTHPAVHLPLSLSPDGAGSWKRCVWIGHTEMDWVWVSGAGWSLVVVSTYHRLSKTVRLKMLTSRYVWLGVNCDDF